MSILSVDGQHRLKIAQKLNLPIYYLIDDNFNSKKMIYYNTVQKNWDINDYLKYWCANGNENYLKIKQVMNTCGFNLSLTLRWLNSDCGSLFKLFREGSYTYDDKKSIERLDNLNSALIVIKELKERNVKPVSMLTQRAFHDALRTFISHPVIIVDRFLDKIKTVPYVLSITNDKRLYIEQFADIYNYEMRKERIKVVRDGRTIKLRI